MVLMMALIVVGLIRLSGISDLNDRIIGKDWAMSDAAAEGDTVTIKVIQCSWNRRTQKYEQAVARDFHALGLKVVWQPVLAEKLRTELEKARESAEKAGVLFDEGKFMEQQRAAEIHRETSGW